MLIKSEKTMATPKRTQWDIEDAHRTLQRAAQIQSDKGMMKDVVAHHNKLTKMLYGGNTMKSLPTKSSPKSKKK